MPAATRRRALCEKRSSVIGRWLRVGAGAAIPVGAASNVPSSARPARSTVPVAHAPAQALAVAGPSFVTIFTPTLSLPAPVKAPSADQASAFAALDSLTDAETRFGDAVVGMRASLDRAQAALVAGAQLWFVRQANASAEYALAASRLVSTFPALQVDVVHAFVADAMGLSLTPRSSPRSVPSPGGACRRRCAPCWREWPLPTNPYVEVRGALAAALRNQELQPADAATAEGTLEQYWSSVRPVELTRAVERHAGQLAADHGLRGADAVHLASALALEDAELVVAVWDRRLHAGVGSVGLRCAPQQLPGRT